MINDYEIWYIVNPDYHITPLGVHFEANFLIKNFKDNISLGILAHEV